MKGLSVLVTVLLFLLASQLPKWLHSKEALPVQSAESQAKKTDPAQLAGAKHLLPTLKI